MIRLATALIFVCLGCAPPPLKSVQNCLQKIPTPGKVLARVGHVTITDREMVKVIDRDGPAGRRLYSNPAKLKALIEDRVRLELLSAAAMERGLHRDPDVVEAARKVMVRKLLEHDMGDQVFGEIDEDRIKKYYDTHTADYRQEAKRRFGHIHLAPTEEGLMLGQALIQKLHDVPEHQALFQKLKAKHSLTTAPKTPGLSELFQSKEEIRQIFGQNFMEAVFGAKSGELIGRPIQSIKGWHVIGLYAVRDALTRSLASVHRNIKERLQKDHRTSVFKSYLRKLKKRHPLALYENRYKHVLDYIQSTSPLSSESSGGNL
jgi:hypothetical protein